MGSRLSIGQVAPPLEFDTLGHGHYVLAEQTGQNGTLVIFHRGRHCKWSRYALKEIDDRIGDFAIRGIRAVAASHEDREATSGLQAQMQLIRLPLGYGLDVAECADAWGLYVTRGSAEPDAPPLNFEPAQFWITGTNRVGVAAIQSGPNLWADATNTIRAIEGAMKFPERGAA